MEDTRKIKVLNGFAGVGGNRKKWKNVFVTAVESDPKIAKVYQDENPEDEVIVEDAFQYLLDHYQEFDFICLGPPCQRNTRMIRSGKNRRPSFPDLRLYECAIFLQYNFKGFWVVENVIPYYKPLMPAKKIGRHLFWSNYEISDFESSQIKGFITNTTTVAGSEKLKEHFGIHYEGNLYYNGNHCPGQVLRNCVHPDLGEHVFNEYLKALTPTKANINK